MRVPQVNRTKSQGSCAWHHSPVLVRGGFTLLELLIVLAILTLAAAAMTPALRGPMQRSRLRSAAVDVQSALGKARAAAVREGLSVSFRCQIGGRHWKIERTGRTTPVSTASGLDATASGLTADDGEDTVQDWNLDEPQREDLLREGWLPDGVRFERVQVQDTGVQLQTGSGNLNEEADESPEESSRWSAPVAFRPEGRSDDALVRLRGADSYVVDVSLRGLTAGVKYSIPFRARPVRSVEEEALDEDFSDFGEGEL